MGEKPHGTNYVSTYQCSECELRVRLETMFKMGSLTHECRRCDAETEHTLTEEPVPEPEAASYV